MIPIGVPLGGNPVTAAITDSRDFSIRAPLGRASYPPVPRRAEFIAA